MMELSHTVLIAQLAITMEPMLPTLAILGSFWVEMWQELVREMDQVPMECGVVQLQYAPVSSFCVWFQKCPSVKDPAHLLKYKAIQCSCCSMSLYLQVLLVLHYLIHQMVLSHFPRIPRLLSWQHLAATQVMVYWEIGC